VTVTNRLENRERPDASLTDTDNGFFFEWRAECDADDCKFREVAYTKEHAEWMVRSHPCPMKYDPPRRYSFLSIAEFYWVELDGTVDEILGWKGSQEDREFIKLQGRASGLAYAVMKACQPYYPDEMSVSKESLKRWKIRKGHLDWEPTPGFKYDPPIPGMTQATQYGGPDAKAPTYNRTKIDRAISQLGTKKVGDIKRALEQGMFPAKDLARVYSIPIDVVEAIERS
jgi:hypothetical protein